MNPFTESTVARPLAELPVFDRRRGNAGARAAKAKPRKPRNKRASVPRPANRDSAGHVVECAAARNPSRFARFFVSSGRCAMQRGRDKSPLRVGRLAASVAVFAALMLPGIVTALDVNLATQEQLQGVRGIGPKTAQTIIDERQRGGRFESFDDLSDRVKGIGPRKAAALQASGLTVDAAAARPPAASATLPTSKEATSKESTARAAESPGSGRASAKPAGSSGVQKGRSAR